MQFLSCSIFRHLNIEEQIRNFLNHVPNNVQVLQESRFCLKIKIRIPHSQARAVRKDRASYFPVRTE